MSEVVFGASLLDRGEAAWETTETAAMRSSEKEPGQNGAASAPWLLDPPKAKARAEESEELEEELERLAKGVAEEVKKEAKAPAAIIVAGGLDEAKAYVPPTLPAAQPKAKTIEVERVRIAKGVDPRQAETQRIDRAAVARIAARRGGLVGAEGNGAESPWAERGEAGVDGARTPSASEPMADAGDGSVNGSIGAGTSSDRERIRGWMLGGALGAALLFGAALVVMMLRNPNGARRQDGEPAASQPSEPGAAPAMTAAVIEPVVAAPLPSWSATPTTTAVATAVVIPAGAGPAAPTAGAVSAGSQPFTAVVPSNRSPVVGGAGAPLGAPRGKPQVTAPSGKPAGKPPATPELSE